MPEKLELAKLPNLNALELRITREIEVNGGPLDLVSHNRCGGLIEIRMGTRYEAHRIKSNPRIVLPLRRWVPLSKFFCGVCRRRVGRVGDKVLRPILKTFHPIDLVLEGGIFMLDNRSAVTTRLLEVSGLRLEHREPDTDKERHYVKIVRIQRPGRPEVVLRARE